MQLNILNPSIYISTGFSKKINYLGNYPVPSFQDNKVKKIENRIRKQMTMYIAIPNT